MDQRLKTKIDMCSIRPQPGTPHGETWERGAEQGWQWAQAEIERLRTALEVCAKATWFDDHDLEFRLTEEAKVARTALHQYG